jgi:hypothetical protein
MDFGPILPAPADRPTASPSQASLLFTSYLGTLVGTISTN